MATEDNEYFSNVLDTLHRYEYRRSKRLSSKKLKESVRRIMDEEEEEMECNISDSKERVDDISDSKEWVDDISDSKEGVDNRNNSAEQVGVTNDSEKLFVDGSDPKSDPSEATHTNNRLAATDTTN